MTRVPVPSPAVVAAQAAQLAALRDLLEAIRDSVKPPRPARHEDLEAFAGLQRDRAIAVHAAAGWALAHWDRPGSAGISAGILRASTSAPDYEPRNDARSRQEAGQ